MAVARYDALDQCNEAILSDMNVSSQALAIAKANHERYAVHLAEELNWRSLAERSITSDDSGLKP